MILFSVDILLKANKKKMIFSKSDEYINDN